MQKNHFENIESKVIIQKRNVQDFSIYAFLRRFQKI